MAKRETSLTDILHSVEKAWFEKDYKFNWKGKKVDNLILKAHIPFTKKTLINKKIYLDTEIVAKVLETFDNLGLITRNGKRPKLNYHHKREDGTWDLQFSLPPGLAYSTIKDKHSRGYFADAVRKYVEIEQKKYLLHMTIFNDDLPTTIPFAWDPRPYLDSMLLPIPIGYALGNKLVVVDLVELIHVLLGGASGFGKSSFNLVLIYALLFLKKCCPERVNLVLVDLKGTDFYKIAHLANVIEKQEQLLLFIESLETEHEKRKQLIKKYGVKKISSIPKSVRPPFIVAIIDEFAEITDKRILTLINHWVRIYRATGIHLIASTQRPSVVGGVMDGDTRGQFSGRFSVKCASETDSRIILGETHPEAAWLPGDTKGRMFYVFGVDSIMVQSMFIDDALEEKLLNDLSAIQKWVVEVKEPKKLLPC